MFENEEEKKKREEEAKAIINSVNTSDFSKTLNSVNFANQNNMKINVENEEQQKLIDKINEGNSIINSINPRKEVKIAEPTEEELQKSRETTARLINLIDGNTAQNNQQQGNENVQQLNSNKNYRFRTNGSKTKEELDQQAKLASNQNVKLKGNEEVNNKTINKDTKIGLAGSEDVKNSTKISTDEIKAMGEANELNKKIEKGGFDKFEASVDIVLSNIWGGVKQTVGGLANLALTGLAFGVRGLSGASKIVGLEEAGNSLDNVYDWTIDKQQDISNTTNYESLVTSQIEDEGIKTAGNVTNVISNMGTSALIGGGIGVSGAVVQGVSVAGNSSQEVLKEDEDNIMQASLTGIAKGYVSYFTERMFDANILTKGMKKTSIQEGVNRLISDKISSEFGKEFANTSVNILGENIEELVEDNGGYLIDKMINGKDMPGFKEWWDNTSETAKTTTISTIILNMLGLGGSSFKEIEGDMEAQHWIGEAQKIIEKENLAIHFNTNETKNSENTDTFYITRFTQEGEIANIVPTKGKTIANPKPELDVAPVIVKDKDTSYYNVIDGNTGVVLDSSPYSTTMEAEGGFNEKANNLSDIQIKDINNKIGKANYSINNELLNMALQAKEELNQMKATDYNINKQNNTKSINTRLEDLNKATNQIQDNSFYNSKRADKIFNTISRDFDNVVYEQKDKNIKTLTVTDSQGNIKYSKDIKTNQPGYTGKTIKNILSNVYNNVMSENNNANAPQTSSEQNASTFYTNESNYAVQDIKKVTEPFDVQETYSKDEMADVWNNSIAQNNYDAYYGKDGNIERYIAIEEEGDNLVVNQYDSNDNIVKSEVVPSENGRYSIKAIKDTIEKVSSLYDENRPIKGQQDIEGNEVLSMKKKIDNKKDTKITKKIEEYIAKNPNLETKINVSTNIVDDINIKEIKQMEAYKTARDLFSQIHKRKFKNNNTEANIYVTNSDIKESINTTYTYAEQRKYLKENIAIYSQLDNIIENAELISNTNELKGRQNYQLWEYYAMSVNIDNNKFIVQFDTVQREDGETHFRVQRLYKITEEGSSTTVVPTKKSATRFTVEPPSTKNSIPQNTKSVKNNTAINKQSMQNKENNALQQENIKKELHKRIQNALISKNSQGRTYLGDVSNKIADKVKSLFGFDVSDKRHVLADNDIRHMIKEHGNPILEKQKGQIAITTKDIEKIPDILANYNRIVQGNDNREGKTIRYIKKYSDNISYVVEVVPEKGKALKIKTMWKKPARVTNGQQTPNLTSKTKPNLGISTSNTSIAQNSQLVKNDDVRAMKRNANKAPKNNIINNLMKDIILKEKDNFKSNIKIDTNVVDKTAKIALNYNKVGQSTLSNIAKRLFNNLHKNVLNNKTEKIYVTNSDINESIAQTLKNPDQKALLKDNLSVFSQLDKIIENAKEIKSSETEIADNKSRTQYKDYKYYYTQAYIDGEQTWIQFDTRVQKGTTGKDERHFRLERIYKINEVSSNGGTENSITHFSNEPTSNTSIAQNSQLVKNEDVRSMKKNTGNTVQNNNTKSTPQIRFAKKTAKPDGEILDPGATNAQREGSYIEQEIRKIEQTGNWDNSIPVTKMTDIRKTIEDYLGLGVQKGHFREQAYGIYKGNRDVIRTKELKDIDTILHETGHALDIGKRINLNKESISNELLNAVNKYGGYEAETREVQLEEGFAEVIREYSIVPDQAKIDYPQTVSVIEGIMQENTDFNNFMKTVQQQTYNYIHQNPRNRILSNQSIGETTKRTPSNLKQEIMRNVYDKDWAVKSAVNEMQKLNGKTTQDLKASENAYYLTRLASGIGDKVTSMISKGYIDENGNKLMPGLDSIGELLNNNPDRFNDLRTLLAANRDLDYKAKTLKTGMRTSDAMTVREQFKNDIPLQESTKLFYDTLDGVLQYTVNNGLITQENADMIRKSNAFYAPMQRVLEGNRNNVGRKGAVADIIKTRTGSELDIKDVLENAISNSVNMIQQVENNNILKAFYKQGEQAGMTGKIYDVIPPPMKKIGTAQLATWETELRKQGVDTTKIDLEKTIDLFAPNNKVDSNNLITSFINDDGKRVYLQFHDEILFNSLMNMDKTFMSAVLNINRKLNMPLRYGATMANLGFAIPNVISDTAQAAIFSEAGFIPVLDNVIGVMDIVSAQNKGAREFFNKIMPGYADRINTLYAIYEQTGATNSTRMSQYRESTQITMKDVYGTKNSEVLGIKEKYKPLKRLLDILTYIPEVSEQSTRFRVFEKNLEYYRRNGMAETDARIQAALQSRDATQDFSRTGNITREINQLIPFSAARVGSAYTFAEKVKANPKRVASRMAVLMAISMAIKAIGYDDKEIEELNQRKKDDNFVFKIGDQIITIKKPQGILRSIINLGEYVQDLFTGHIEEGKEGERLVEWATNSIMDNMPADSVTGLVPNMIAPVVENAINKDLYYNSDIVKSYDLELPDSEQYYDYNSQLAIWLGKIFNYSPAKIDNLISGYFAGLGTSVTNVIDWISGKTGISPEEPDNGLEDNAVGKRFFVNVNTNSQSVDEIYSLKTDLTKKANGGTITAEEKKQLEAVTEAISNISKLNKQVKEIKADLTMSGKEKAEQIDILQRQKVDTARQALGKELLYSENQERIEDTKFYPTRDSLSQNKRTLTLTPEMKKEYEELASEYYSRYEKQGLYSEEKLEQLKSKAKEYAKKSLMKKYRNELVKDE